MLRTMFSAIVKAGTRPSSRRSSGTWATPASKTRRGVGLTSRAADADRAADDAAQPGDRLHQLGLAVALDAGDRDDLARRGRRGRGRATARWPRSSRTDRPATSSTGSPGVGAALVDLEVDGPADHHLGQRLLGRLGRGRLSRRPCRAGGP